MLLKDAKNVIYASVKMEGPKGAPRKAVLESLLKQDSSHYCQMDAGASAPVEKYVSFTVHALITSTLLVSHSHMVSVKSATSVLVKMALHYAL